MIMIKIENNNRLNIMLLKL